MKYLVCCFLEAFFYAFMGFCDGLSFIFFRGYLNFCSKKFNFFDFDSYNLF